MGAASRSSRRVRRARRWPCAAPGGRRRRVRGLHLLRGVPRHRDPGRRRERAAGAAAGVRLRRAGQIALGSVKANLGHLRAAAGAAGLRGQRLALQHGEIPVQAAFEQENPRLELEHSPFYVPRETRRLETRRGAPARAAVSAFSFGGNNFHVVLEAHAPAVQRRAVPNVPPSSRSRWWAWAASSPVPTTCRVSAPAEGGHRSHADPSRRALRHRALLRSGPRAAGQELHLPRLLPGPASDRRTRACGSRRPRGPPWIPRTSSA